MEKIELKQMYTRLHFPHLNTCLKRFDDNCRLVKSGNARQKCTLCEHTHAAQHTIAYTNLGWLSNEPFI